MAEYNGMKMRLFIGESPEMRPCWVKDGESERKALFHCWEHRQDLISASVMAGGHPAGTISRTLAIVEYEDGTVHEVYPYYIRFIDSEALINQFYFGNEDEENEQTNP